MDKNENLTGSSKSGLIVIFPDVEKLQTEIEKLRTELSMLVIEHDELLYVECKNIEMTYMLLLGGLEFKAYELKCTVLRLKRKIELVRAKKNRQEKIELSVIEEILDAEFAKYQEKIKEQLEKMNSAIERYQCKPLSTEEAAELKKLYRAIVKVLHPDLNPEQEKGKVQLFYKAVIAYENGDIDGLRIINEMVSGTVLHEVMPEAKSQMSKERDRLLKLLQNIKDRIAKIKSQYPYTMKEIIVNPEKIQAEKTRLEEIINGLNETLAAYTVKLTEILR